MQEIWVKIGKTEVLVLEAIVLLGITAIGQVF